MPSTGAAAVAPANDAWTQTAGAAAALAMVRTRIASAAATITVGNTGVAGNTCLLRQYVSESIPYAQTITGKFYGVMRCIESSAANSDTLAVSVRACSSDGGTIRTPALLAISASDASTVAPYEMAASLTSSTFWDVNENNYLALTSCTISANDRIVVEIGYRNGATVTSRTGGVSCHDDSATDLNWGNLETAANNPWIEFTADLFCRPGQGYFS